MRSLSNFFKNNLPQNRKKKSDSEKNRSDPNSDKVKKTKFHPQNVKGLIKDFNFKRKTKAKKNFILVLDIGTEFVKALVLKIEPIEDQFIRLEDQGNSGQIGPKNKGLVIGIGRQRQLPGQMKAGAITDIEGVSWACQKAIEQASQMARVKPNKAIVGIAGEFIKGSTTNFLYQRDNPDSKINLAELKNIIQKIQWKAFDRMKSQLAWETGRSEVEIRLINALVTEMKIDGYQIANPLDFQGKDIFLSIFNVYAPLVQLKAVENITSKLKLELLSIVAEPYALAKSLKFDSKGGAIFIDVGGRTTDVALVRRGSVEGIKSFNLAGRTFTRRLAQALNLGLAEAEEIKIKHACQNLSQGVQRKIRDILEEDTKTWLAGIELILDEFNQSLSQTVRQEKLFPSLILLCGGGSLLPGIRSVLKRETVRNKWIDNFPFSQAPQVRFAHCNHINNIFDQTGFLSGPESITPIALADLALEIVDEQNKVLPSLLRRVTRIMR